MALPNTPVLLSPNAWEFITSPDYNNMRNSLGIGATSSPTFSTLTLSAPASATSSILNLQVGGTSVFSIDKAGAVTLQGTLFKIGYGGGSINTNTAIGFNTFLANATGTFNTALGVNSLVAATSGVGNIAFGGSTLRGLTSGNYNTAIGLNAGYYIADGTTILNSSTESVYVGYRSRAQAAGQTNQIAIGAEAVGMGSNTVNIGNASIVETRLNGLVNIYNPGVAINSTSYERLEMGYNGSTGTFQVGTGRGSAGGIGRPLQFVTGNAIRATISPLGSVGIGTIAPGARLEVVDLNSTGILVSQTWDTVNSPTALKVNVTNTASGSSARLMDLQIGGTSLITVDKLGALTVQGTLLKIGYGGGAINTNIAIGQNALTANTTGTFSTAVGVNALVAATTSIGNIAFGGSVLRGITSGNYNTAMGLNAGYYIADGTTILTNATQSIFVGYRARALDAGQTNQIVIGSEAIGIGSNTTMIGNLNTLETRLSGKITTYNTYTNSALYNGFEVSFNTTTNAYQLATVSTTGSVRPLHLLTNGQVRFAIASLTGNIGIGTIAPNAKVEINDTTRAVGAVSFPALRVSQLWDTVLDVSGALELNVTNTQSGANSKLLNITVNSNSLFSVDKQGALYLQGNLFKIGYGGNGSVNTNTAIGVNVLTANTTGAFNTAIGANSVAATTTASGNIAVGGSTLRALTSGNYNTAIGLNAGYYIADGTTVLTSATESIFIGQRARAQAAGQTNQIVIGSETVGMGSNTATIGNASTIETRLRGKVTVYSTYASTTDYSRVSLGYDSASTSFQVGTVSSGSGTIRPLQLITNNISRLHINTTGEVGIGTVTPVAGMALHVAGPLKADIVATASSVSGFNLTDNLAGYTMIMGNTTNATITMPAGTGSDTTVSRTIGYNVTFVKGSGAGTVTFAAGDKTIVSINGNLKMAGIGAKVTVTCIGINTYLVAGDLIA